MKKTEWKNPDATVTVEAASFNPDGLLIGVLLHVAARTPAAANKLIKEATEEIFGEYQIAYHIHDYSLIPPESDFPVARWTGSIKAEIGNGHE